MAIQGSGIITLQDIEDEFGGTGSISLSEYYRGGSYVPNITANNSIPTSGQIQMADFYGTQSAFVTTVTEGTTSNGSGSNRGYYGGNFNPMPFSGQLGLGNMGSRSPTTFNGIVIGCLFVHRSTKDNNTKFAFGTDPGSHTARTQTGVFSSLDIEGGGNLTASSASFRAATGVFFGNVWTWTISGSVSTSWATWDGSGTRTVTINE